MNLPAYLKNNTRLVFGSDFLRFVLVILTFTQKKEVTGQTNKSLLARDQDPRQRKSVPMLRHSLWRQLGTNQDMSQTVGYHTGHEPDSWAPPRLDPDSK